MHNDSALFGVANVKSLCDIADTPAVSPDRSSAMPFDAFSYPSSTAADVSPAGLIDAAVELCPTWTALNPDRALAFLFVAPQDCTAVDVIAAL